MSSKLSLNELPEEKLKKLVRQHERRIKSFMEMPFNAFARRCLQILGKFGLSKTRNADDYNTYIRKAYRQAASDKKPKRMELLSRQLWGGYSSYALNDLLSEYRAGKSETPAQADLAWEIARWYDFCRSHEEVLSLLSSLDWKSLSKDRQVAFLLLEVEALRCLGRIEEASAALKEAEQRLGNDIDINLLRANVLRSSRDAGLSGLDRERLGHINRVFNDAGLLEIQKIDEGRPLLIDNIVAPVPEWLRKSTAKKISVIVPTYNAASTIEYALNSLSNQTWSNLEILVADDNSNDGTIDIVQRLASADDRIRVIRLDRNYGTYAARNKALELATGDFVTVKDSDDWSHPQKLQIQAENLLGRKAVANTSYWARVSADLQFSGGVRQRPRLLHQNFSSLMLPTGLAKELGGWDPVLFAGDAEFMARIESIYGAKKIVQVGEKMPLSFGLNRDDSLTNGTASQLLTLFGGARNDYAEAWRRWHKAAKSVDDFRVAPDPSALRRFPAPSNMLSGRTGARNYDVIFVSDFSSANRHIRFVLTELRAAVESGAKVGIFHWPGYDADSLQNPCDEVAELIDQFRIEALVYAQRASAEKLVFFLSRSFQFLFDRVPAITSEDARLIDPEDPYGALAMDSPEHEESLKNIHSLFGIAPALQRALPAKGIPVGAGTNVGAISVKDALRVPVVFGISLASSRVVVNWQRTLTLLRYTLRSLLDQTHPDFQVFVCAHDKIGIPEARDPRIEWVLSDQPPPKSGNPVALRADKMHKRKMILSRLKRFGECYFMPLDADDLVNSRLVEFLHRDRHPFGYRFSSGLVFDHFNQVIAPVPGVWNSPFDLVCGSSIMARFQFEKPERKKQETEDSVESVMTKSHAYWQITLQEHGRPLAKLPFFGSIYMLNHGNNLSFHAQRADDRKQWLVDSIRQHQIPLEDIFADFPVLKKIVADAKGPEKA